MENASSYLPAPNIQGGSPGVINELFEYGIHNEAAQIRAHIAVYAQTLYVFPRINAVRVMTQYPKKAAFQEGVQGPTAMGYIVPPTAIKDIRRLKISEHRLVGFDEKLPEGKKGMLAVGVVSAFLKAGRFPLWLDGEFVEDVDIQITGDDIHVNGHWKIEVKCDYRASECYGRPHPRCTGNLYLQIAERNPMKKF